MGSCRSGAGGAADAAPRSLFSLCPGRATRGSAATPAAGPASEAGQDPTEHARPPAQRGSTRWTLPGPGVGPRRGGAGAWSGRRCRGPGWKAGEGHLACR